ncbi:MAG: nitrous oxide-stimulated promoter family protein [Proteobacteria bacterium]|nr:nitrous oxide-stimulated promoter family protein [Pseudomonadota bacterium]
MISLTGRLKREHQTLVCMTAIYCKAHHNHQNDGLCDNCTDLMDYSAARLAKCPYGQTKPNCNKCPIYCYKKQPRDYVRRIMRYSGPRMLVQHPFRALAHTLNKLRQAIHPRELRRARNRNQ